MTTFKPMLAVNSKPTDIKKPNFGSIKLEGVRGICKPEGLLTRQLKPFKNRLIEERMAPVIDFCNRHGVILDGEFYVHGWDFNKIDRCLRGDGNIDASSLEFHVFDCFVPSHPDTDFENRIGYYEWCVDRLYMEGVDFVHGVQQTLMGDADEILKAYMWALDNGYEGFCLKCGELPYKHGRSTLKQEYFTRIKPEKTYDCVVLDILERQHNLCESEINELGYLKKRQDKDKKMGAGMAQTAVVFTPELGKVHKVSLTRGLTDPDRCRIWDNRPDHIGSCMQFVGIPVPGQDIPRSPRFDKWRGDVEPKFIAHHESSCLLVSWDEAEYASALDQGCEPCTMEHWFSLMGDNYALGS